MFGFAAPYQSHMGPLAGRLMQPMQQQQSMTPVDPSKFGALPGMGDIRSGMAKLGMGSRVPPGTNQPGYSSAVTNMTSPVGFTPPMGSPTPYDPSAITTGLPSSAAAGGADAAAGAGAAEGAGAGAAASGGFDISQILAFLGI